MALDVQDIPEYPEIRACPAFKAPQDHPEGQDYLVPLDHPGVQVIKGHLGCRDLQEKWGIQGQEAWWEIQGHQDSQE